MTNGGCEQMAERMPEVAHGGGQWSDREAAHLASCPECQAEWRLVREASRLGQSTAARLDPARLSATVLAEVRRRRQHDRWRRGAWVTALAAAAAVVLVVWTGSGKGPRSLATGVDSGATAPVELGIQLPLSELESLDSEQLQAVLDGLDAPVGVVSPGPAPSFGELDDTQLERVLRSLEG
jgi:anti-sigma factor RsiW